MKKQKVKNRHDKMASQGKHRVSTKARKMSNSKFGMKKASGKHKKGSHKTLLA
jgi:hypothetical protein